MPIKPSARKPGTGAKRPLAMDAESVRDRARRDLASRLRIWAAFHGYDGESISRLLGCGFVRATALLAGSTMPKADEWDRLEAILAGD
jgi:hypothetical protein